MKRGLIVLLAVVVGAAGALAGDAHHHPEVSDDARFEFLKQLEGTWVGDGLDDKPGGVYEFRVTAGGTAVREIEMVGTPMEMVTLYHMEGDDLVATHYCMLGNRPRMKAAERIARGTLEFECAGTPGGAASRVGGQNRGRLRGSRATVGLHNAEGCLRSRAAILSTTV